MSDSPLTAEADRLVEYFLIVGAEERALAAAGREEAAAAGGGSGRAGDAAERCCTKAPHSVSVRIDAGRKETQVSNSASARLHRSAQASPRSVCSREQSLAGQGLR